MFKDNPMIGWVKRSVGTQLGIFVWLYLAFLIAGFAATVMLFGLFSAFPHLDPDTVYLKASALTSADGPIALFLFWLILIPVCVWNKCSRVLVSYYGRRLEEFAIVMFSGLLGSIIAIGLFGLGWESLPQTLAYSGLTLFISQTARNFVPLKTRGDQAVAAISALIAFGVFLTGPALWPTWFLNYVTL